jgi:ferritin
VPVHLIGHHRIVEQIARCPARGGGADALVGELRPTALNSMPSTRCLPASVMTSVGSAGSSVRARFRRLALQAGSGPQLLRPARQATVAPMKLTPKLEHALNDQINLEFASFYAYLAMAAHFEHTPYSGMAQWMRLQSEEEFGHAKKFFDYLVRRGGKVKLQPIGQPELDFAAPIDAFRASLAHEQKVSKAICALYELASAERDYPTHSFLEWFLDEQVEEEKLVGDFIAKLELIGDNRNGLFHMDKLAAKRVAGERKPA